MSGALRWVRRPSVLVASAVIAALVLAGAVVAVTSVTSAPRDAAGRPIDCTSDAREDVASARAAADACGFDVEILAERTPWQQSWAIADGETRLVMSAAATATSVNGEWEPVDATIGEAPGSDGMLASIAPVYRVAFNPGGEAGKSLPLGTITREGVTLTMWFPLALPEPVVDGAVVTYELFDGASVIVFVSEDGTGFSPIVKLDTPAAAAEFKDRLAQARAAEDLPGSGWDIPFRVELPAGHEIVRRAGGAFEVVAEDGEVEFAAPPALMWDAAGGEPSGDPDAGVPPLEDEGEITPPPVRGPNAWPGDASVQMPVRIDGDSVIVTPSADFLSDAGTVWPVRIDPTIDAQGASEWTMLRTGGFTSSIYKFTDAGTGYPGGGMGRCNEAGCNTDYTARLVWEFSGMNALKAAAGADVSSAQLDVYGVHSYNCTATSAYLYTTSGISSSSTWSSVTWGDKIDTKSYAHRESCSNDRWVAYDATAAAKEFAEENKSAIVLGLKAGSESSMAGWKRYRKDAKLTVVYNRAPSTPTAVSANGKTCATGTNAPYISTALPTLYATGADPDSSDKVKIEFDVTDTSTSSKAFGYTTALAAQAGSPRAVRATKVVTAGKLTTGKRYKLRARSGDASKWSGWSAWCEFVVETSNPPTPTIAPVTTGVAAVYPDGVEAGGAGMPGKFAVTTDAAKVVKLDIGVTKGTVSPAAFAVSTSTPGPFTFTFTPAAPGVYPITVTATGKSGLTSRKTYSVVVAGIREGAIWMLDEGSGMSAADSSGNTSPRALTLSGAGWTDGPHSLFGTRPSDRALLLDGGDDSAKTTGPPLSSDSAFTVSTFVWLDPAATGADRVAISQDGANASGFELGYRASCAPSGQGCWSFSIPAGDSATANRTVVYSAKPAVPGQWVLLVADRSQAGSQIRLWTCPIGTPTDPTSAEPVVASVPLSGSGWRADGGLVVGRAKQGGEVRWWKGAVDNVRVYPGQVVSEPKVRRLCAGAEATDFGGNLDALDPTIAEDGQ